MFATPVLALLLAAPPADTYTLQWKLKEGDVFYTKSTAVMEQTIEVMGQTVENKVETKGVLRFKVKSTTRRATVVEMTFLETKIDAPGGADLGEKMKGVTFTVTLDDKLKITKFEGYEKFLDALTDGDASKKKLMKTMMPESMLRRSFDQTFLFAPDKPVAVGDKWDRSENLSLGALGTMDVKFGCKLDGVKGDVATVVMKGDLTWKGSAADTDLPFKISKADVKTDKFDTTFRFDMKAGRPLDSKIEMNMSGTMTIEVGGMTVDAKLKQKMTMTGTVTDQNPIKD
jgi:hypothetical protein